mmetsp:Transcript_48473/g.62208  ORF Transcript_48473/g.62208 Transcript_48473/m.62208 type:complete len:178 (-) Transcript_48473:258-791(-)
MNWDSAAAAIDNSAHTKKNSLNAPLLPNDELVTPSDDSQKGSVSSIISDEIFYGNGKGLKLVYNVKNEEDFERELAEEREREIIQTTESLRKVHEVFAELGGLVQAQQTDIDVIENQVTEAHERTKGGVSQLNSAVKSQGSLNSCYVYMLVFILFVLIVMMLFLFWDDIAGTNDGDD